jgi:hypothetical protein
MNAPVLPLQPGSSKAAEQPISMPKAAEPKKPPAARSAPVAEAETGDTPSVTERIAPEPPTREATDFSWGRDNESIIIREQPETAVYWNPTGQIVIRQKADPFEEDPWLLFSEEFIPALIRDLADKIGVADQIHEALWKAGK